MGKQEMKPAVASAPAGKQTVARLSGGGGKPRNGLGPAPAQHLAGDPTGLEPTRDLTGFGARLGAQAVIDDHPDGRAAAPRRPTGSEQAQREAVGTAGNRYGKSGTRLEGTQPIEPESKVGRCDGTFSHGN